MIRITIPPEILKTNPKSHLVKSSAEVQKNPKTVFICEHPLSPGLSHGEERGALGAKVLSSLAHVLVFL